MPECPDQSSNITGCEPPFPPVPSPTITPAPINMCRCSSVVNGLTGINNGSFANVTGGNGFLVEVFIRKDTSASGTSLEDSFYLKWPGQITGNHFNQDTPASSLSTNTKIGVTPDKTIVAVCEI